MKGPRFCEVTWEDAWCDGVDDVTFENVGDKHKPVLMITRGWVLIDNDIGVSMFYEKQADSTSYRGRTFIPKGMIKSIEDFPRIRKRKPKPLKQQEPLSS